MANIFVHVAIFIIYVIGLFNTKNDYERALISLVFIIAQILTALAFRILK